LDFVNRQIRQCEGEEKESREAMQLEGAVWLRKSPWWLASRLLSGSAVVGAGPWRAGDVVGRI
jgi:hypothetical protein